MFEGACSTSFKVTQLEVASWETLDSLHGVVSLGGNALEDCEKLYDD